MPASLEHRKRMLADLEGMAMVHIPKVAEGERTSPPNQGSAGKPPVISEARNIDLLDMAFRSGALSVHLELAREALISAESCLPKSEGEIKRATRSRIEAIDRILSEIDAAESERR